MAYPQSFDYPPHDAPPVWTTEFVQLLVDARPLIDSTVVDGLSSDRVLAVLASGLAGLGYSVETGKRAVETIRRPVLFGDQGVGRGLDVGRDDFAVGGGEGVGGSTTGLDVAEQGLTRSRVSIVPSRCNSRSPNHDRRAASRYGPPIETLSSTTTPSFRQGMGAMLEAARISVTGEAADGADALRIVVGVGGALASAVAAFDAVGMGGLVRAVGFLVAGVRSSLGDLRHPARRSSRVRGRGPLTLDQRTTEWVANMRPGGVPNDHRLMVLADGQNRPVCGVKIG